jgi:hypothetical protein
MSAEPIPAGGSRVSFTIPEQPPLLQGVELQGAFRALELLAQAEAAREVALAPSSDVQPEDDGELLEQAIDLAAAAADAAAQAPERPAEPKSHADPIRSLAELFGLEPDPEPPQLEDEAAEAEVEAPPVEEIEAEVGVEEESPPAAEVVVEEELQEVEAEGPEEEAVEGEPDPEEEPPVIDLPRPDEAPEPAAAGDVELQPLPEPEPVPEPLAIPEPVPASEGLSPEPALQRPAMPPKAFVPDPLHPATAILRALAEEYDDESNRFRGR